jgi:SAM-dependent methyltransferase
LFDAVYGERVADVGVYLGLARALPGPVLELGAGSGRLLGPLLADQLDAYGIELDSEMLAGGRRRLYGLGGARLRRRLLRGDMRDFALGRLFSLVVVAGNTLSLLLRDDDLRATLACVRQHLKPEGTLAFDVARVEGHGWYREPFEWLSPGEAVKVGSVPATFVERGSFDPESRLCRVKRDFRLSDGRRSTLTSVTRQREIPSLIEHLVQAGFDCPPPLDERGAPVSAGSCLAFFRASPSCGEDAAG